jgi:hypothetical protein
MHSEENMAQLTEEMNRTELLVCAEQQKLGTLRRSIGRKRLEKLVLGEEEPRDIEECGTLAPRKATALFITRYRDRCTLPISVGGVECSGDCTSYGCPPAIAINCHLDISRR